MSDVGTMLLSPLSDSDSHPKRSAEQVGQTSTVFVVVPTFNRRDVARKCLRSLAEQDGRFEVVVVDDGSTDGTSDMVRSEFPHVRLLQGDGNLWWSGATNLGVQYALAKGGEADFVLTLNDDTEIPPGYLNTLLGFGIEHPGALVGSVLLDLDDPDVIIDGGVHISWITARYVNLNQSRNYPTVRSGTARDHRVDLLSGRGMLIPLTVFRQVGLFDAVALPQYAADYELARRAHRAGFELLVDYDSFLWTRRSPVPSWREWLMSFRSTRSANHVGTRYRFAARACPKWLLPSFLLLDVVRSTIGSLRRRLWPRLSKGRN